MLLTPKKLATFLEERRPTLKKTQFAAKCKMSRFTLHRILKGETNIDPFRDVLLKAIEKYESIPPGDHAKKKLKELKQRLEKSNLRREKLLKQINKIESK